MKKRQKAIGIQGLLLQNKWSGILKAKARANLLILGVGGVGLNWDGTSEHRYIGAKSKSSA